MIQAEGSRPIVVTRFSTHALLLAAWGLLQGLSYPAANLWLLAHVALTPLVLLAVYSEPTFVARAAGLIPCGVAVVVGVLLAVMGIVPTLAMLLIAAGMGWAGVVLLGAKWPSLRRAALVMAAGWLWWIIMLRWMVPVTEWGTLAVSAYKALYLVAFVVIIRRVTRTLGLPLTLTTPIVWTALEYLRGQVMLSGFPWFYLGHSQPLVMIQIADAVGAPGVTFIVAMTSGLIGDALTRPLTARTTRFAAAAWAAVVIASALYGMYRLGETTEDGPVLHVAVVQSNVPQSNKDSGRPEDEEATFAQLMRLSRAAVSGEPRADLIVWPETMAPRALDDESTLLFRQMAPKLARYRDEIEAFAREHRVHMVIGAHAMVDWREQADRSYRPARRYNSAFLFGPGGDMAGRYDKVHRVPFGEYIPWVDDLPSVKKLMLALTPYEHDYTLTPGDKWIRFEIPGGSGKTWRFAAPICFEDAMSYVPRQMVYGEIGGREKQADLLLNLTNDGWFAGTSQSVQHEQIGRFRCVENRVSEARAVNTGVSGVLDSCGRLVARVETDGRQTDVTGVSVAAVRYDPRVTLFGRVGDAFAVLCTAGLVWLTAWTLIRGLSARPGR